MTDSRGAARRQLVPRWRAWRTTAALGEASNPRRDGDPVASVARVPYLIEEYRQHPNVGRAGDVLSSASAYGIRTEDVLAIASSVQAEHPGTALAELAEGLLDTDGDKYSRLFGVEPSDSAARIRRLRAILVREPRNALRWVDLSREYATLGQQRQAGRAISVALQLAPEHRFVLRSASALYSSQTEYDRALALLSRSERALRDPWLLAALIAVEDLANAKQRRHREARSLLEGDFPEMHLAELAAAMGTIEIENGSERRGRQLLRRSTKQPTENALAQVEWIASNRSEIITGRVPEVPRAFEAGARRAEFEGRWSDAMMLSRDWLLDQPFSVQAACFGSFCACEAEDWQGCVEIVEAGRRANPSDLTLLNNLAFAQVSVGALQEALATLREARSLVGSRDELLVLAATEALFMFRAGRADVGRSRYRAVVNAFGRRQSREQAAKAALMLAREELLAQSDDADTAWKKAAQMSQDCRRPDVRAIRTKVEDLFENAREFITVAPRSCSMEVQALATPLMIDPEVLAADARR